jgi:lipooligosaccharide transport system permease protein
MTQISFSPWGVYSVWWRNLKVYQSTWLLNFLPPVSEPLFYLLAFSYGLTPLVGDITYLGEPVTYPRFLAPGIMGFGILIQAFFEGSYGTFTRLNFQKLWQALLAAPLSFTDVFVGEWLWASTKGLIAGVLTGLLAIAFGLYSWVHLLGSLPLLILGSLLFGAFGLFVAGFMDKLSHINIPFFLIVIPMWLLSGTYFPRETLPPLMAKLVNLLPLANLVDLLRWPLGLSPHWPFALAWLILLTIVMARLAAWVIYPRVFR